MHSAALGRAHDRVDHAGDALRPVAELRAVLLGHPEHLREDLDGQRVCELGDEVDLGPAVAVLLQQAVEGVVDPRR